MMKSLIASGMLALAGLFVLAGVTACQVAPLRSVPSAGVTASGPSPGSRVVADGTLPTSSTGSSAVVWGEVPKQCT